MPIAPHWDDIDGVWDRVGLGEAQPLPGVWTVTGSVGRNLDVKTRPSQDTARIKNRGYRNAELTLVGRITTVEELNALETALAKIHPRRKGKREDALAITHPATALMGVKLVLVKTVNAPTLANGLMEIRIDVIEYVPQPKKKKKGKPDIQEKDVLANIAAFADVLGFDPENPPSGTALDFIELDSLP